jgi:hypothetical protein
MKMKNNLFRFVVLLILPTLLCLFSSCGTMRSTRAIGHAGNAMPAPGHSLYLAGLHVDKADGGWSVYQELLRLLPFLFFKQGYIFVENEAASDYRAEVSMVERQFMLGWKQKKSIAIDISCTPTHTEKTFPVAHARTIAEDRVGLSSSRVALKLVSKTVKAIIPLLEAVP